MNKTRLPRLQTAYKYTTGDSQEWTYEYTWEDFKVASIATQLTDPSMLFMKCLSYLIWHFKQCPEKLMEDPQNKDKSIEEIQQWLDVYERILLTGNADPTQWQSVIDNFNNNLNGKGTV